MNWTVEYLPEATEDIEKLNGSVRPQVLKGIQKVRQNPLPKSRGGYGEPLGNKGGNNLTGLYKIKFKAIGIRVVYQLVECDGVMRIVIVSLRSENQVYEGAAKRKEKYDI